MILLGFMTILKLPPTCWAFLIEKEVPKSLGARDGKAVIVGSQSFR
jgi:hypothetical protein